MVSLREDRSDDEYDTNAASMTRTRGPLAGPDAPGTIPRLAFHRAKLSSSASSWAYSSMVFAVPAL